MASGTEFDKVCVCVFHERVWGTFIVCMGYGICYYPTCVYYASTFIWKNHLATKCILHLFLTDYFTNAYSNATIAWFVISCNNVVNILQAGIPTSRERGMPEMLSSQLAGMFHTTSSSSSTSSNYGSTYLTLLHSGRVLILDLINVVTSDGAIQGVL